MALDQVANFIRGSADGAVDSTQTSIDVADASVFPDPSSGEYNVVIWDADNFPRPDQDADVEICRVTAQDTGADTLTVDRGQEGTTGAAHPDGSAIHLSPTAKMFSDIESRYVAEGEDFDGQGTSEFTNLQAVTTERADTKTSPFVNAAWFGATGDGTDQTSAINDAVAFSTGTGNNGPVYFPPGQYEFSDQLIFDIPGVGIIGASQYETRLTYTGDEDRAIVPADEEQVYKEFTLLGGSGANLHGIATDPATYSFNGLQQTYFEHVQVRDFTNTGGYGFHMIDVDQTTFVGCDAKANESGWRVESNGGATNLINCQGRQSTGGNGLELEGSRGKNVYGGNYATNTDGYGIVIGPTAQTNGIVISGVYTEGNGSGVGINAARASGAYIDIQHTGEGTGVLLDDATACTVSGSGSWNNANEAVQLGTASNSATRCVILGDIEQRGGGTDITNTDATGGTCQYRNSSIVNFANDVTVYSIWGFQPGAGSISTTNAYYVDDGSNTASGNPNWMYSTDGGSTWTTFGS